MFGLLDDNDVSLGSFDTLELRMFVMKFAEFAEWLVTVFEHELSVDLDGKADYDADFERCVHPREIGFLPNMGLRISFD